MTLTPTPTEPCSAPGSTGDSAPRSRANLATGRERFLRACCCQPAAPTPIWLMRQAGRVLPEYRALKERYSFLELVRTPDLATEVTLQPVRRFGFDAAILFSDILVIPEALGQGYRFLDAGGIAMDFAIRDAAAIESLEPARVPERLAYVDAALRQIRPALGGRTALIGFSGSPWTLANFMVEGGSSRSFTLALDLYRRDRALYDRLAGRLTEAIIAYLRLQVAAGAEALQLFDTLGSLLPAADFEGASGRWLRDIVRALAGTVPVIVFSKGATVGARGLKDLGAAVLGFDHLASLAAVRKELPADIAIQGNLDPAALESTPERITLQTRAVLDAMRGRPGHIFNLGHGVPPGAPLENLEALVRTVREFPASEEAR